MILHLQGHKKHDYDDDAVYALVPRHIRVGICFSQIIFSAENLSTHHLQCDKIEGAGKTREIFLILVLVNFSE